MFTIIAVVILSSCSPRITSFTPGKGTPPTAGNPGTTVTINGKHFGATVADNTVKFGNTVATDVLSADTNKIDARVPSDAVTGIISVTTSEGTGESKTNFEVTELPEWTFMVYLDADNNLESAGIDDFLEMATVGSSSDINIVVQMDRHGGHDNTYGDWTGTRRFLINSGDAPNAPPLADLGEQNMGDPDTLQGFVEWAVQTYPAQRYALSIWNHGGGWRYLVERRLTRARQDVAAAAVAFRTVAWDDTDGDELYMSEVQSALEAAKQRLEERSTTAVKLDVVGFDACLMGMIEIDYALRNVADYVVGSEWVEPGDGWPYDTILTELSNTPSFDGSDLSAVIVTQYGLSYGDGVTQSAVDMAELNNVISKIDAFATAMNTEWAALRTARGNTICYHYVWAVDSTWGVDLWDFADNVRNEVTSTAIKDAAQDVKTAIDAFVINEHHSGAAMDGSHGVAIYFPATQTIFNADPEHPGYEQANPVHPVDFVRYHRWDEFLQDYYTNAP